MGMEFQQVSGPPWLAIADKITSEHITTVLDHSGKSQEIEHKESKGARQERLIVLGLMAGLLVFFTLIVLPESPDIYAQILGAISLFFAGGIGGYGIGINRGRRSN